MTFVRRPPSVASWESRLLGLVTVALAVFGVAAVYSASSIDAVNDGLPGSWYALRQFQVVIVGFVVLLVATRVDYSVWKKLAWPIVAIVFVALLIPLLPFTEGIAPVRNGARRWIALGPLNFQPSEAAKFALIAWTAMLAAKKGTRVREFRFGLVPFLVIMAPLCFMIAIEPDLSTAMLTMLVCMIVLFSAGAKIGHFLLVGVLALPVVWGQIASFQFRLNRMLSFLSPGEDPLNLDWQITQSIIGVGSGGIFGVGFGEGMQKLGYLPYAHSDFIFSTIGEEWGFLGLTAVLVLYAGYVYLGMRIARQAPDRFATLLTVGLTSLIGVTAILHMSVTLALVPTTGLVLPFISYGRSNLLVALLATGVIMNIGNANRVGRRG